MKRLFLLLLVAAALPALAADSAPGTKGSSDAHAYMLVMFDDDTGRGAGYAMVIGPWMATYVKRS